MWRRWSNGRDVEWAPPHSPTLTPLHLNHSSLPNPSAALPTSGLILQPFRCFTYAIGTSPTSTGEAPRPLWWCLIYSWWFCNVQWLRPAGLYERCKLALELKRLKNPGLEATMILSVVVACALVTQRARVRSPVGTSFLGEVFLGVFPHL